MATAIKVENLSKIYRLGEIGTGTISRDIERFVKTKIFKQEDPFLKIGETNDRATKGESDIIYSLKDINFEIEQGDAVGIIGRNGAGKSTLLKILSRVTSPTTGKINIKGRVASLLEVGTGFHPELTGRENIYLNGAILGMRKREIDRKLDEIIDFSGVERYIDTPVKRYSSGMYVRLAFAVAAHLESEILIVDEVLAVGDAEFQKKCLGKMKEVSKSEGKTVLFVSHNIGAVVKLCDRGIILKNGTIKFDGNINDVEKIYLYQAKENPIDEVVFGDKFGDEIARLISAKIQNQRKKSPFYTNDTIEILISYEIMKDGYKPLVNLHFITEKGEYVFATIDNSFKKEKLSKGIYCKLLKIPSYFFSSTNYFINIHLTTMSPEITHCIAEELLVLSVQDSYDDVIRQGYNAFFPGVIRPFFEWENVY